MGSVVDGMKGDGNVIRPRVNRSKNDITYTADDVLMISQVGLAVPAPVDLAAVEVDVVRETHGAVCGDVGVAVGGRSSSSRGEGV